MPVTKKGTSSSTVVRTKVVESYSSMTSLKNVSHKRSSSGKMLETWSSPSMMLTSPQTWISGSKALFLSPVKSPSPKRRITRRSSLYVKPGREGKSQMKSKEVFGSKAPASSVSKKTKVSSVSLKSSPKSASAKLSSVYSKTKKETSGTSFVTVEEESELVLTQGRKSKMSLSKSKKPKISSPQGKKVQSPSSKTRSRKRNASELEKEQSPEKPAAKRKKGQDYGEDASHSPKKGKKTPLKSPPKQSKDSSKKVKSSPSAFKVIEKRAEQSETVTTSKRARKSLSPRKTRGGKSLQAMGRSPANIGKSVQAKQQKEAEQAGNAGIDFNESVRKTKKRSAEDDISPQSPKKKVGKRSPVMRQKTPLSGQKDASSKSSRSRASSASAKKRLSSSASSSMLISESETPEKKTLSRRGKKAVQVSRKSSTPKSASKSRRSLSKGSSSSTKKGSSSSTKKSSKKKQEKVEDSVDSAAVKMILSELKTTPKRKVHTPKTKRLSSSTTRSKSSSTSTKRGKGKQIAHSESSFTEESSKIILKGNTSTPKSGYKSKGKSQKSSIKRPRSIRSAGKSAQTSTTENFDSLDGSYIGAFEQKSKKTVLQTTPKRKVQTPKTKRLSSSTTNTKASPATPKQRKGRQTSYSEGSFTEESSKMSLKGNTSTPKSSNKSRGKLQKSSSKKSRSIRSIGKSAQTSTTENFDSLDGSFIGTSAQKSKKTSKSPSKSTKKRNSTLKQTARNVEDEKILEILRKAVNATPTRGKVSTPKSAKYSTGKLLQNQGKTATPKSQKSTKALNSSRNAQITPKFVNASVTKKGSSKTASRSLLNSSSRSSVKNLSTPVKQSGKASTSTKVSNIFLRDADSLSDREQLLTRSDMGELSVNRRAQLLSPRSSLLDKEYHADKAFSQYVERSSGSGIERYGSWAIERSHGDQTYRAGSYHIQRNKGHHTETEEEEEQWEEEDVNNSAVSLSEDPNASVSTSVYSNRCAIL